MGEGQKDVDEIVDESADEALHVDESSVFSKKELRKLIRDKLTKDPDKKKEYVDTYNEVAVSRRDFLKVLGVIGAGGIAAAVSFDAFFDQHGLIGYATMDGANAVDLGAEANLSPGDALDPVVNSRQGETLLVPGNEYSLDTAMELAAGTKLMFDGATIDPGDGNGTVFRCSGDGWQVGGDVDILQEERNFMNVYIRGNGQFGDQNGRISWVGNADPDSIPCKRMGNNCSKAQGRFLNLASGGEISIVNVDQHGPPPNTRTDANLTWTRNFDKINVIGCDFRRFNDNGFYIKAYLGEFVMKHCYMKDNNVAQVRTGANGGTYVDSCCWVATDNENPAVISCKVLGCGYNHSGMAFQDRDGTTGPVEIKNTHYKKTGGNGSFLRDMGNAGGTDITVQDCQWTGYPNPGVGGVTKKGDNGGNPEDCEGPYAFC